MIQLTKVEPREVVPNEYLEFYLKITGQTLEQATGDEESWFNRDGGLSEHTARDYAIQRWGFAVPTDQALVSIAAHSPIIEIGAGHGYWAYLLKERFGADVRAFDPHPVETGKNGYFNEKRIASTYKSNESLARLSEKESYLRHQYKQLDLPPFEPKSYVEVAQDESTSLVKHYPEAALFLCWPPYADSMANDVLQQYTGNRLFYIGEGEGGCTADDDFHGRLQYEWTCIERIRIPQWWGIHDELYHYVRGRNPKLEIPPKCDCDDWRKIPCVLCWDAGERTSGPWRRAKEKDG
jgi:hypothetical protein